MAEEAKKQEKKVSAFENPSKDKAKCKFTKSPTGAYKLGYSIGEIASLPKNQVEELIEAGYAVEVK